MAFAVSAYAEEPDGFTTAKLTSERISERQTAADQAALKDILQASPAAERLLKEQGIGWDRRLGSLTLPADAKTGRSLHLPYNLPGTESATLVESDYNGGKIAILTVFDKGGKKHFTYLQDGKIIKQESPKADPDVDVVLGEGAQTILDNHRVRLDRKAGKIIAGGTELVYKVPGTQRVRIDPLGLDTVVAVIHDNDGGRTYVEITEGVPGDPRYEKPIQ